MPRVSKLISNFLSRALARQIPVRQMHPTTPAPAAKPIIIDSDIYSDVDDVGALAIANVLHNCGLAHIKGVMVSTPSKYGCLAVSAINTYYDNGDVPIGAARPFSDIKFKDTRAGVLGEFASRVAQSFPRTLQDPSLSYTPVDLYRKILAEAEDDSITIITIGFLTNLAALLQSPADAHSKLTGLELVRQKVHELVVMGGRYPQSGKSWNFSGQSPADAQLAIQSFPGRITFFGTKPGDSIFSGSLFAGDKRQDSPVAAAYRWYVNRESTTHKSWDPITVLFGVLGVDGFGALGVPNLFAYANESGYNQLTDDGTNEWVDDATVTNQHWLRLADGVTEASVAWLLDQLYALDPTKRASLDFKAGFAAVLSRDSGASEL